MIKNRVNKSIAALTCVAAAGCGPNNQAFESDFTDAFESMGNMDIASAIAAGHNKRSEVKIDENQSLVFYANGEYSEDGLAEDIAQVMGDYFAATMSGAGNIEIAVHDVSLNLLGLELVQLNYVGDRRDTELYMNDVYNSAMAFSIEDDASYVISDDSTMEGVDFAVCLSHVPRVESVDNAAVTSEFGPDVNVNIGAIVCTGLGLALQSIDRGESYTEYAQNSECQFVSSGDTYFAAPQMTNIAYTQLTNMTPLPNIAEAFGLASRIC